MIGLGLGCSSPHVGGMWYPAGSLIPRLGYLLTSRSCLPRQLADSKAGHPPGPCCCLGSGNGCRKRCLQRALRGLSAWAASFFQTNCVSLGADFSGRCELGAQPQPGCKCPGRLRGRGKALHWIGNNSVDQGTENTTSALLLAG
jgi:hypothetical protein